MPIDIDARISPEFFASYVPFKNGNYEGVCHPAIAMYIQSDKFSNLLKQQREVKIQKIKRNIIFDIKTPELNLLGFEWINIKSEKSITFSKSLLANFRGSKAQRAFHMACLLTEYNLDTPIPMGYIERRRKNRIIENYYLSESLHPQLNLRELAQKSDKSSVEPVLNSVANFANRLHNAGVMHRDMNLGNFLVHRDESGLRIAMIDLNRCIRLPYFPAVMKVKDISRLYWKKSRDDFFYIYCNERKNLLRLKWFFDIYISYRRQRHRIKKLAI